MTARDHVRDSDGHHENHSGHKEIYHPGIRLVRNAPHPDQAPKCVRDNLREADPKTLEFARAQANGRVEGGWGAEAQMLPVFGEMEARVAGHADGGLRLAELPALRARRVQTEPGLRPGRVQVQVQV